MKNVLVLISSASHPALNDGAIRCAVDVLRAQGATVGTPDWLAPEVACDIPFDGPSTGVAMTALDGVVVPAEGRRKKLLVADMESTMIGNEMLAKLENFPENRRHTARMNGEIDFAAALASSRPAESARGRLDEAPKRILHAGRHASGSDHEEARCLLRWYQAASPISPRW